MFCCASVYVELCLHLCVYRSLDRRTVYLVLFGLLGGTVCILLTTHLPKIARQIVVTLLVAVQVQAQLHIDAGAAEQQQAAEPRLSQAAAEALRRFRRLARRLRVIQYLNLIGFCLQHICLLPQASPWRRVCEIRQNISAGHIIL